MTYVKTNWENGKTPINADNLNKIEEGIANAVAKDSEARVSNVVSRNMLDLKKVEFHACRLHNEGLISYINPYYYSFVQAIYLKEWFLANKGKTITLSVGKAIHDRYIAIVIFGSFSDGSTYQIEQKNNSSEVSLTITENLLDINSIELRFNGNSQEFTDTTTTIPYMQLEIGDKATEYVPYLNLEEAMQENIYTTNERKIGTWIDGKPIYRRIINCVLNTTPTIKYTDYIIETIISIKGIATNNGNVLMLNHFLSGSTEDNYATVWANDNNIWGICSSAYDGANCQIIIEYTKITD